MHGSGALGVPVSIWPRTLYDGGWAEEQFPPNTMRMSSVPTQGHQLIIFLQLRLFNEILAFAIETELQFYPLD